MDVALKDDVVWVTNGLYCTGGRAAAGVGMTTNRVWVQLPLTVRSVNGPEVTIIEGKVDTTSLPRREAVRGVLLAANAVLSGFTCAVVAPPATIRPAEACTPTAVQ